MTAHVITEILLIASNYKYRYNIIMKIILFVPLIFLTTNIYADKNWIEIESENKPKTQKENIKIEPIIKQVLYGTKKKTAANTNDKNWFVLHTEESK